MRNNRSTIMGRGKSQAGCRRSTPLGGSVHGKYNKITGKRESRRYRTYVSPKQTEMQRRNTGIGLKNGKIRKAGEQHGKNKAVQIKNVQ